MTAHGSAALLKQLIHCALEQSSDEPAALRRTADQLMRSSSPRRSCLHCERCVECRAYVRCFTLVRMWSCRYTARVIDSGVADTALQDESVVIQSIRRSLLQAGKRQHADRYTILATSDIEPRDAHAAQCCQSHRALQAC